MKKLLLLTALLVSGLAAQAQGINFGIKAGANFSKITGDIDSDSRTNFHAGAVVELNIVPMFSVQAEGLFTSQGGKYDDAFGAAKDLNLDYIAVPLLAKFYVLPNTLSITAGPQFSFLVNDADEILDTKKFDVAASGGLELKIIAGLFAQARYNIGLTKVSDSEFAGDAKNAVFQLSVGYFF